MWCLLAGVCMSIKLVLRLYSVRMRTRALMQVLQCRGDIRLGVVMYCRQWWDSIFVTVIGTFRAMGQTYLHCNKWSGARMVESRDTSVCLLHPLYAHVLYSYSHAVVRIGIWLCVSAIYMVNRCHIAAVWRPYGMIFIAYIVVWVLYHMLKYSATSPIYQRSRLLL